jgi:crotonobetainyl-CoA:carnitine CoA-transferase CaiB-like acyl-CoA transferase
VFYTQKSQKNTPSPLSGRIILDCSTHLPGPFVGKLLADQGARVLKVEHPTKRDPALKMGRAYDYLNTSKELIFLDLLNGSDQKKFLELVKTADGLIEGFLPKTKVKLGLAFDSLHQINPQLCVASLVGYPEDSELSQRPAHNMNFEALTGILSFFEGLPGLPLADLFSSYQAAFRLTAAMDGVSRGKASGTRVLISLSEALDNAQGILIHELQNQRFA